MDFDLNQRRRSGKIIPRRIPLSMEVKKSIYLLIFALLAIIVIISIVFLLNTSLSSQKGYILQQEQNKKELLILENHGLINKIIQAMTFKRIEESPLLQNMQKPVELEYIKETPKDE